MSDGLWAIDTGYAYGGIIVTDGKVAEAAPIFRWMRGKPILDVLAWRKIKHFQHVNSDPAPQMELF